ncbi:cytochrome P450 2K1-like [Elgaria multicarinata webbii]|uniref:cytochrome P450 2K1-like n=1 Tax=Elgaria multicarinata webbii TaxID=159646 RepID=UPI002FCD3810
MFPVIPICVGLLVFFFLRHLLNIQQARQKLPAGPVPLPIIGNLGMVGFQLHHETLLKMATTYGDIYTLWLGHTPVIVLNGFKAVKEVLIDHSEDFADRLIPQFLNDIVENAHGILFSNGYEWKQQRRFSLMLLRNLGLGKSILEDRIRQEAGSLVQAFMQEKGKPVDPYSPILLSVNNVISAMLLGHCFSEDDDAFHRLIKGSKATEAFTGSLWPRVYEAFPRLMKFLQPVMNKSLEPFIHMHDIRSLVKEEIECHKRSGSPEAPRDFIDSYLAELKKQSTKEMSKEGPISGFTEANMVEVIAELFIAGSDTSTVALCWALLYMVVYPEIQERVQEELDTVLGSSHIIRYEDRKILPFTSAVLHETQRYSGLNSLGVIHKCSRNTTLQGLPITKGTIVFPNLFSVHYDPEEWETPRKFNPGHFLDKDGNFINKQAFLPFSAGVRVCLGEKLARTTLFILFASLLRAFRFQMPEGVKEISCEPILGFVLQPHPFKICAIPR